MYPTLSPGQTLGSYRIQAKVATDTFGTMYLGTQHKTAAPAILKVLTLPGSDLVPGDHLFTLGQRLLTLRHPAILPIWEIHLTHNPPYLVMSHARGGSLGQRLALTFPASLPMPQAISIIRGIGEALHFLHAQQIVHAGVQPSCIMLGDQGQPLLSGFDLAHASGHPAPSRPGYAEPYAAPEQRQGRFTTGGDLYALGRVAYQLVTGATPNQQSPSHLVHLIARGQIPPPLGRAILHAIADAPAYRLSSMAAFLAACEA